MLAQGQASSAKRGGLAVVSSGLIFLKKKKKEIEIETQRLSDWLQVETEPRSEPRSTSSKFLGAVLGMA